MDLNSLIRENVKQMSAYSSARDEFDAKDSDFLFLDANENPFDSGFNRYPDPYQKQLKSKIKEVKQVPENNMLLGNGSDEILDLIFRTFCEPQVDEIITLTPTYGMYEVLANLNNIAIKRINLTPEFQINVDLILKSISPNTKLIFICSPNNPSGNLFQINDIKTILKTFSGLVVLDEAYIDFSDRSSFISELNNFPNLIVTQTFSKALAHAGIRLGMCFASERIIEVLNKIKPPYNVNQLTQNKAIEVLNNFENYQLQIQILKSEREILTEKLKTINWIENVFPSEANFLLCRVDDANRRYQQLLEEKIVVRNRSNVVLCHNCLRISVGTPAENQKLIQVLNDI
ncbi:histidinol-phosphate transaminase [Psychroflexus aestuariivivens]|uniref:histidinol-phosphate transaminase n=1 Tax=Psychroflexus aestuariivivens TaxID=1795040 RepID=UPI000FD9DC23|nr:histidinol-phosphate transaminase [Psychroflexus aestuariivivens]